MYTPFYFIHPLLHCTWLEWVKLQLGVDVMLSWSFGVVSIHHNACRWFHVLNCVLSMSLNINIEYNKYLYFISKKLLHTIKIFKLLNYGINIAIRNMMWPNQQASNTISSYIKGSCLYIDWPIGKGVRL